MDAGPPPEVRRDPWGNAIGGIRLPEMQAPTAEYRGMSFHTGRAPLFGASRPFSAEVLGALYPSREAYAARWYEAVDRLVNSGAVRPEDAAAMKIRAADVRLPFEPV
jgi:hypothetical protein